MSSRDENEGSNKALKKKKRKRRRRIILIVEIILLILLLIFLFIWLKFGRIDYQDIGIIATNKLDAKTEEMLKGYTTIAFFGVDNREIGNYESGNSDSIILCSINNDTKKVKFVSIYRDTYMDVDGTGKYRKCNYAYNHGGPKESLKMLNRNLDLDVQDYVSVDFKAVVDAVDAVGGITLDITDEEAKVMNEAYVPNISAETGVDSKPVKAGTGVKVNGVQALAYCRVRYTSGDDFMRASRQRTVLQKLIEKVKKSNPIELNNLIDSMFDEISTSLSATEMTGLISHVTAYEFGDSAGYPFDKYPKKINDSIGDVVVPCTVETNVIKLYYYMYDDADHECSSTVLDISDDIEKKTGLTENDAVDYSQYEGSQVELPSDTSSGSADDSSGE